MKLKFLLLGLSLSMNIVYGHSGRTDGNGGHNNRSTGLYHYHNADYSKNTSSREYIVSIFHHKVFKGFGDTFKSKKECMSERHILWKKNKNAGWTYGCRKL